MSLEENVKELTVAVVELTTAIINQTQVVSGKIASPLAAVASEKKETTQKHSLEDLRTFAGKLVKADQANGYETAKEILEKFKVARFDELGTNVYDAVAKEFEAAIKKVKKSKPGTVTLG